MLNYILFPLIIQQRAVSESLNLNRINPYLVDIKDPLVLPWLEPPRRSNYPRSYPKDFVNLLVGIDIA